MLKTFNKEMKMFEWIKRFFKKNKKSEVKVDQELELLRYKRKVELLQEELDWFHDLGLPTHQVINGKFDYYNHLKDKIVGLQEDKRALVAENSHLYKMLKQKEAMESLYLEEISKLKNELTVLKTAAYYEKANFESKKVETEQMSAPEEKCLVREEEIETEEEMTPLKQVRKKIKGMNLNKFDRRA